MFLIMSIAAGLADDPAPEPDADDGGTRTDGLRAGESPTRRSRGRILLVEDNTDLAELEQMMLESEGYEVATVADGVAALREVMAQRPALVVLDVGLPKLSGLEVASRVRRDERTRRLPILFATAEREALRGACQIPCRWCDVLLKPFDPEQLLKKIQALLSPKAL